MQKGVAYAVKKNPEVGVRRIPPQYTTGCRGISFIDTAWQLTGTPD